MTSLKKSDELFHRASVKIPGAVNSPVRAWKAVGDAPIFIESGSGATITDTDGNIFLDYVCSYGPAILGHAHPRVVEAIAQQLMQLGGGELLDMEPVPWALSRFDAETRVRRNEHDSPSGPTYARGLREK